MDWEQEQLSKQKEIIKRIIDEPSLFVKNPKKYINDSGLCCVFNSQISNGALCGSRNVQKIDNGQYMLEMLNGISLKCLIETTPNITIKASKSTFPPGMNRKPKQSNSMNTLPNIYIGTDEFTNNTIIGYMLYMLWDRVKLPKMSIKPLGSALCSDTGLNLYSPYNNLLSDMAPGYRDKYLEILPCHVDNILRQITASLSYLQSNYGFVHGNLTLNNVIAVTESTKTRYEGLEIHGDFRCVLKGFKHSSINMYRSDSVLRFFNESELANLYLKLNSFTDDSVDGVYKLKGVDSHIQNRVRHMGIPFYKSYDFYIFIVSMMLHKDYKEVLNRDFQWLYSELLWDKNEIEELKFRLEKYRKPLDVLKGLTLYDDVIEIVFMWLSNEIDIKRPCGTDRHIEPIEVGMEVVIQL